MSWEIGAPINQGSFTYILMQALRGQSAPRCATVSQLDNYLREQVPKLNINYKKKIQNPTSAISPQNKKSLILIPKFAEKEDVKNLFIQALEAENKKEWLLAWQLFIRVIEVNKDSELNAKAKSALLRLKIIAPELQPITNSAFDDVIDINPIEPNEDRANQSKSKDVNSTQSQVYRIINFVLVFLQKRWIFTGLGTLVFSLILFEFYYFNPTLRPNSIPTNTQEDKFISYGSKSLFDPNYFNLSIQDLKNKESAMKAYDNKDFYKAFSILKEMRERAKEDVKNSTNIKNIKSSAFAVLKDPELLIYMNNAKTNLNNKSKLPIYTFAVVVPAKDEVARHFLFGVAQSQAETLAEAEVSESQNVNFQIAIVDDNNSINQAQHVAHILAEDPKVVGVIGHFLSSTTCKTLRIYDDKNLLIVSPASRAYNLRNDCGGDRNKIFFRTAASSKLEAESLGNYFLSQGIKHSFHKDIPVFYNDSDLYSRSVANEFQNFFQGKNYEVTVSLYKLLDSKVDVNSVISKADAVAIFPDGQNQKSRTEATRIIQKYGKTKLFMAGNTLYFWNSLSQLVNMGIPEGKLIIAVDWHPRQSGASYFANKAKELWYGDVNFRTALAYQSTKVLTSGLSQVQSEDNIRLALNRQIYTLGSMASGVLNDEIISFDNNTGERIQNTNVCVTPTSTSYVNVENEHEPVYKIVAPCP